VIKAYAQYEAGEIFNEDRMTIFRELLKGVQTALLTNAALVVTTLTSAASAWIYNTVTPEIIIVDEAARALEPDLLPLSAHYPLTRGKVLVGDINQLRPVSHSVSITKGNPGRNFAAQHTLSLIHRLQKSGFLVTMLKT
jgi:superfamily I DNA and/or RNA helicase